MVKVHIKRHVIGIDAINVFNYVIDQIKLTLGSDPLQGRYFC